jgi:hypothetical protein
VLALNNKARTETEPLGAEEAAKRYQLSTKLYSKSEVDLTHAECTLLMERIAAIFESPLVIGRIGDILEGREISLPEEAEDDEVVAKNLDLTISAPKDPSKPAVQPSKSAKKSNGGE